MNELQSRIWDFLVDMVDGEEVARAFTNYLGNQVLDDGFAEFLADEYGFEYGDEEDM